MTAYTEGSSVTVDGTCYYYNRTFEAALETDADALDYDLNEAYTLVLDEYGYAKFLGCLFACMPFQYILNNC